MPAVSTILRDRNRLCNAGGAFDVAHEVIITSSNANSHPVVNISSGVTCWVQLLSIMTCTIYCVLASSPCSRDMVDVVRR